MATSRMSSVLRHLTTTGCCQLRTLRASNQRRWAQVHDVRFLTTEQPARAVLEKYREKLDRKAREEGLPDIDALKKAYADKIEAARKQQAIEDAALAATAAASAAGPAPPPPATGAASPIATTTQQRSKLASSSRNGGGVKPLDAILDLPKVRALPVKELTAIWRLRHAEKPNSLCAVIPADTYAAMEATARLHPQFVVPVPHPGQGAEIHFLQWTWDPAANGASTVLFTQLAEYKARGEFTTPHTTVTHYKDLAAEKGVVLMQGHVADDKGVTADHAQWLVMCLQRFYGGWDGVGDDAARERAEERKRLLSWFAKGDSRFSVEKLLEEAERMG
ncbi:ATP11 protein-domain-containing protein [Podospora didyma]|uniref:ATP11 protein-domain-containing protein n=1 Tax=Podospora didyma TaxID=330526 RepID=A0AAE0P695_9PEZI|nr:ATP11 protein-domain-containing protein [Podospora didyma]